MDSDSAELEHLKEEKQRLNQQIAELEEELTEFKRESHQRSNQDKIDVAFAMNSDRVMFVLHKIGEAETLAFSELEENLVGYKGWLLIGYLMKAHLIEEVEESFTLTPLGKRVFSDELDPHVNSQKGGTTVTNNAVQAPVLDLPLVGKGKVRDVYRDPDLPGQLVVHTTNRASVFDKVLEDLIPGKGRVLNALSSHFLLLLKEWVGVENHLVDNEVTKALIGQVERDHPELVGQVSVWREVTPVKIEFIVRRHITGSLYREYSKGERNILGHQFPPGLADGVDLREMIFTPSTKAEQGHDENITVEAYVVRMEQQFPSQGIALAKDFQYKVLDAGRRVYEYCRKRGIVFLDSKFEFGVVLGPGGSIVEFIFIDEAVTPDSSRFCKVEDWEAGRLVPYDKELIRQDVLQAAVKAGFPMGSEGFDDFVGQYRLPADIIEQTAARYEEIARMLIS